MKKALKEIEKRLNELENQREADNAKRKHDKIISFILLFVAIISAVVAVVSAYQSRKSIDLQYKPELQVEYGLFGMTWDENGETLDSSEMVYQEVERRVYNDIIDGSAHFSIQNIAANPAKDIVIDWNYKENIAVLKSELSRFNIDMDVYFEDDLVVTRKDDNKPIKTQVEYDMEINYLSSEHPYNLKSVYLPNIYYQIIREIMRKNIDYQWELPLELGYTYKDLQNKEYSGMIKLIITPSFCYGYNNEIIDGKNGCVLRIEGEIIE